MSRAKQVFTIQFRRLPRVGGSDGLVMLAIGASNGAEPPRLRRVGALTDVALRGRLSHHDLHSANELAALRQALRVDHGQFTVHEGWSGLGSCLKFWHSFTGSEIQIVEWTCERCAAPNREDVGASVGETISRACKCGQVTRITTRARLTPI